MCVGGCRSADGGGWGGGEGEGREGRGWRGDGRMLGVAVCKRRVEMLAEPGRGPGPGQQQGPAAGGSAVVLCEAARDGRMLPTLCP